MKTKQCNDRTFYRQEVVKLIDGYDTPGLPSRVVAKAEVHRIGAQDAYFSLTAEGPRDFGARTAGFWAEHFPELAHLKRWHLFAWSTGPMHYLANAAYWAGFDGRWCGDKQNDPPNLTHLKSTIAWGALEGEEDDQELAEVLARVAELRRIPEGAAELAAQRGRFTKQLEGRLPGLYEAFDQDMATIFGDYEPPVTLRAVRDQVEWLPAEALVALTDGGAWELKPESTELCHPYWFSCDDCRTWHQEWAGYGYQVSNGEFYLNEWTCDRDGNWDCGTSSLIPDPERTVAELEQKLLVECLETRLDYAEHVAETGEDPCGEYCVTRSLETPATYRLIVQRTEDDRAKIRVWQQAGQDRWLGARHLDQSAREYFGLHGSGILGEDDPGLDASEHILEEVYYIGWVDEFTLTWDKILGLSEQPAQKIPGSALPLRVVEFTLEVSAEVPESSIGTQLRNAAARDVLSSREHLEYWHGAQDTSEGGDDDQE